MLTFTCSGCGAMVRVEDPGAPPFRCPSASPGDDVDHLLQRVGGPDCPFPDEGDPNPFVRYRHLLPAHALALDTLLSDTAFVQLVRELDDGVTRVDGKGFRETPFEPQPALAERIGCTEGEVWVKDETGNVSGSHKARHLMGVMLYLLVDGRAAGLAAAGRARPWGPYDTTADSTTRVGLRGAAGRPPLAIASCGNAALAAAIVARAAGWRLDVFVPPSAPPSVLERLSEVSAEIHVCERAEGAPGDPCYLAFQDEVAGGSIPFCCQGPDNALTIDGGKTLAWEMVSGLRRQSGGSWGASGLDAVFVQVGGGALASSIIQGFGDALRDDAIDRLPRFFAVQTTGGYPLKRAYDSVAERVLARIPLVVDRGFSPASDPDRADLMKEHPDIVSEEMHAARTHRSEFMRPWERAPHSVAHGILDDETYDWAVVVEGMLRTGGWPLVVSEDRLIDANVVAREATGIDVDHTGSAGLAGLMKGIGIDTRFASQRVAVIFSGVQR